MTPSKPLSDINGYVREVYLENNVEIETSTVIFPQNLPVNWARVEVGDVIYNFSKVKGIQISDCSHVSLQSSAVTIRNGTGFYSQVEVPAVFNVTASNPHFTVNIICKNGTYTYTGVSQLSVESKYGFALFARTPTMSANSAVFRGLYLDHSDADFSGQILQTSGYTQFTVKIADNYNAIGNLTLGAFSLNDSITSNYNYLSVIVYEAILFVAAAPIFAIVLVAFKRWHNKPKKNPKGTR
jgi:hypothetical protein